MKKNILYIIVFILSLSACDKLELVPISNRSTEDFYKNETEINQALVACYGSAQKHFVREFYSYRLTESRSDNGFQGTYYDDYKISIFTSDDVQPVFNEAWAGAYNMIYRCNKILEVLPGVELDEAIANQFEGEAKFLRALVYFDLVRFFGDIPLVTGLLSIEEGYTIERSSVAHVYN
ncbi:MAG: RagB/SusD family nutrient uptake outer membrane protein, partial [Bacteroidetes bacterium]|nr:RagB/SusD family nutrient uptake outer membrane protein [Bacteroidota bacterium]